MPAQAIRSEADLLEMIVEDGLWTLPDDDQDYICFIPDAFKS